MNQEERQEILERISEISTIINEGLYGDRVEEKELKQELRDLNRLINKR